MVDEETADPTRMAYFADLTNIARDLYQERDIEIDQVLNERQLLEADDGVWVAAWVWVPRELIKEEGPCQNQNKKRPGWSLPPG